MHNDLRSLGRAKNSVLAFFEKTLYVPKIYLDATWDGESLDVLAIDRAGGGDVHAVLLCEAPRPAFDPFSLYNQKEALDAADRIFQPALDNVQKLPAQYKYVAAVNMEALLCDPLLAIPPTLIDRSYDPLGLGRVGFFSIDPGGDGEPRIKLVQKPERFRATVSKLVDDYIEHHSPDWEIRP